jgi:uncharacterized protein YkwD
MDLSVYFSYMNTILLSFVMLLSGVNEAIISIPVQDDKQAALSYLNKVRQSPSTFSAEIGVDLSYVKARPLLVWNETLAKVAQSKAEDMRDRGYFAHVDPDGNGTNIKIHEAGYTLTASFVDNKSNNFFESLGAGYGSGVEGIKALILDQGTNPPGHRNHLLGIDSFWANCTDVGIGFARGGSYRTYMVVLIAKHDF